jgi:hypothetical protein
MLTDDCIHCAKPIEFALSSKRVGEDAVRVERGWDYDWFHVGGDRRCADGANVAERPSRCPQCKSTNYVFDQTDPWADYTRCGDCGHVDRRSLGD